MTAEIRLFGGLVCGNADLNAFGLRKFQLDIPQDSTVGELVTYLGLHPSTNLVVMVNGRAQAYECVLRRDCTVSVFPPMLDRTYDPFAKLS